MKKRGPIAIAFSVCLFVAVTASVLFAHHSQAAFDLEKSVTIEGTVTQVNWANPHSLFFMEAKATGDTEMKKWALEAPSPVGLTKVGWTQDSVKVGDKITAVGNPSRSGRPMMLVKEVTVPGGKHISTGGYGNNDPARRVQATGGATPESRTGE